MKKSILLTITIMACTMAFSQTGNTLFQQDGKKTDTCIVDLSKAKFVKIGDRIFSVDQLNNSIPLFVDINWIAACYGFIQTSKNAEFTTGDIDKIKMPLLPYMNALQKQQPAPKQ